MKRLIRKLLLKNKKENTFIIHQQAPTLIENLYLIKPIPSSLFESSIPVDIFRIIFSFLSLYELYSFSLVSKYLFSLTLIQLKEFKIRITSWNRDVIYCPSNEDYNNISFKDLEVITFF